MIIPIKTSMNVKYVTKNISNSNVPSVVNTAREKDIAVKIVGQNFQKRTQLTQVAELQPLLLVRFQNLH